MFGEVVTTREFRCKPHFTQGSGTSCWTWYLLTSPPHSDTRLPFRLELEPSALTPPVHTIKKSYFLQKSMLYLSSRPHLQTVFTPVYQIIKQISFWKMTKLDKLIHMQHTWAEHRGEAAGVGGFPLGLAHAKNVHVHQGL